MTYTYDQGSTVSYSTGRLTEVNNGSVQVMYSGYDPLGRILNSNEQTAGQQYYFQYAYDLAGELTKEVYPSGRTVTNSYDAAGRVTQVSGIMWGVTTNYAVPSGYYPHGAPEYITYGNTLVRGFLYNSRLQPSYIGDALNNSNQQYLGILTYNWGSTNNNGNLQGLEEYAGRPVPSSSMTIFSGTYGYDGVNRLTSVYDSSSTCPEPSDYTCWYRQFQYDQYGNMYVTADGGVPLAGNTPTSVGEFNGNNQIVGTAYDGSGNQLSVNGDTASYDAENRQTQVIENGAAETYIYDGNGQRVQKTLSGATRTYVYDAFGNLAAEYAPAGTLSKDYIRLSGQVAAIEHVASGSPCVTCSLSYDHLGNVRMVTDQNGNVIARHDYLPFGEEVAGPPSPTGRTAALLFGAVDQVTQRFTGKVRDSETGLDYFGARYYGSALGRFTSVDPDNAGADPSNPQSWNAYSYVFNSPLSNTDPDGEDTCKDGSYADACVTDTPPDPIQTIPFPQGPPQQPPTTNPAPVQPGPVVNPGGNTGNCVAGFTAAGAGVGAGVGGFVGGGIGAVGGAGAGAAGGSLVAPGVGTIGGGIAGGVAGEAAGSAGGALVGGGFGAGAGYLLGNIVCASGGGTGGSGVGGGSGGGGGGLSPKAKSKLGNLAGRAGEKVRDVIRSRGGSGANVQRVGQWADRTLGEAAEAAVNGDPNAETAVKVAKQAGRLGQQY